jgi:parvulin-like peptidyl-prolyl isomerase
MMKKVVIAISLLICQVSIAQTISKELKQIKTPDQANEFIAKNPGASIETISSDKDTIGISARILLGKAGEIITADNYTCKIIESKTVGSFRASYIYLDGSKLKIPIIDSLRQVIISNYKAGASFQELAEKFNMDANKNKGDLGWFKEGMMVKKFEQAVSNAKKGEIFTVDIPENNWYYVVLKTFSNREVKSMTFIKTKSR